MSDKTIEQLGAVSQAIMAIEDPFVGNLLLNSFRISLNMLSQLQDPANTEGRIDISEQINQVCELLGFDLREMVTHILSQSTQTNVAPLSDKEPDAATLEFITSNLDDYEKFLAQNKAKENIEFLNGVI